MKKILFPTDFTATSENAFKYALHIANQFNASIATVHTFTAPVVATTPMVMVEEMAELTEQYEMQEYQAFSKKMHQVAADLGFSHIEINHTLEYGLAVEEIVKMSKKEVCDMIVMGTDGNDGFGRWLFGSHAAKVVSKATCPVLIIPNEATYQPIRKIAYATSFEDIDDNVINDLVTWIGRFGAELTFVHIASKGEYIDAEQYANMSELTDLAERYDNVKFKIIYDNDVLDELEDYVEDEDFDMLVMVTHRYPFFKRLFNPSLTRQMAFETEIPLLVYQAPED